MGAGSFFSPVVYRGLKGVRKQEAVANQGGGGAYSFAACLSHSTIDYPSLSSWFSFLAGHLSGLNSRVFGSRRRSQSEGAGGGECEHEQTISTFQAHCMYYAHAQKYGNLSECSSPGARGTFRRFLFTGPRSKTSTSSPSLLLCAEIFCALNLCFALVHTYIYIYSVFRVLLPFSYFPSSPFFSNLFLVFSDVFSWLELFFRWRFWFLS